MLKILVDSIPSVLMMLQCIFLTRFLPDRL